MKKLALFQGNCTNYSIRSNNLDLKYNRPIAKSHYSNSPYFRTYCTLYILNFLARNVPKKNPYKQDIHYSGSGLGGIQNVGFRVPVASLTIQSQLYVLIILSAVKR